MRRHAVDEEHQRAPISRDHRGGRAPAAQDLGREQEVAGQVLATAFDLEQARPDDVKPGQRLALRSSVRQLQGA